MLKNFKYMWAHHRGFVLLSWAYLFPATITYLIGHDAHDAVSIGGLGILLAAYPIWKYA